MADQLQSRREGSRLNRLLLWLVEPRPGVTDPESRMKARLLASALIPLLVLNGIGAMVLTVQLGTLYTPNLFGCFGLFLAYFLSRTRHHTLGALIGFLSFSMPSFLVAFAKLPEQPASATAAFFWLALAVVFSSFTLSVWQSVLVNTGLLLSLPLFAELIEHGHLLNLKQPLSVLAVLASYSTISALVLSETRRATLAEVRERQRAEQALQRANELLEQRVAEQTQALRKANETLEALVASSAAAVVMIDQDGRVALWNPSAERIFGWVAQDVLGRPNPVLPSGQALDPLRPFGVDPLNRLASDLTLVTKAGGRVEVSLTAAPVRDAQGHPLGSIGVAIDNSKNRLLEAELRQAQKMEAVGRLAGGIAHDFNNLLTVMTGNTDLILLDVKAESELLPMIEEIRWACQRASALTRQLLAFSRRGVVSIQPVDLNEVIEGFHKMIRRLLDPGIAIRLKLDPTIGPIRADRVQIEQVLMNLAVNAADAMPQGGELLIETSADLFVEAKVVGGQPIDRAVTLTMHDTGVGMPPEVRDHLFEPFFSTKAPGKGTGLGLSTVYGIVNQCGGAIEVESQPGAGSTFRIYFPVTETGKTARGAADGDRTPPRGNETILLIEDVDNLRALTAILLRRLGYEVLLAENGQAAIERFGGDLGRIDLVLTDVVMPEMDGPACIAVLRSRRPDIKVLFMSGHAERVGSFDASKDPLLLKPFNQLELALALREALAAPEKLSQTGTA